MAGVQRRTGGPGEGSSGSNDGSVKAGGIKVNESLLSVVLHD